MNQEPVDSLFHYQSLDFQPIFSRLINEQTERETRATEHLYLAKKESARNLKYELGRQVLQKEQNKQLAFEQFLEEKKLIDDLVQKIRAEDR